MVIQMELFCLVEITSLVNLSYLTPNIIPAVSNERHVEIVSTNQIQFLF